MRIGVGEDGRSMLVLYPETEAERQAINDTYKAYEVTDNQILSARIEAGASDSLSLIVHIGKIKEE